jgi:hypothetical protein
MKSIKTLFLFFLFNLKGYGAFSQAVLQDKIYETYDASVSKDNTALYNGTEFTDLFLNTDGTYRYFNGFDYTKGTVTYKGQYFVAVLLKYDLLDDNLLTRSDDNLSVFNVKLIPDFVESFSIYNRNFVRLENTNLNISGNSFFEEAYIGNKLSLYIKHSKQKKNKALNTGIQYKFLDNNYYILKNNGVYTVITSAKDLRKIFPKQNEIIRNYYKTYKALYKANPDNFMIKLVENLDRLNKNPNQ